MNFWPQASDFNSRKVCFRREVTTGSIHLRLSSDCVSEFDLASTTDEANRSRFIFDKHHIEFETLDSKIAEGIFKIIPIEFKSKIYVLEETQVFLFFHVSKIQEHTMIWSDLFDVELYDENLKMTNQVWEETLQVFSNDLDDGGLEKLCERKEVYIHEERFDIVSV